MPETLFRITNQYCKYSHASKLLVYLYGFIFSMAISIYEGVKIHICYNMLYATLALYNICFYQELYAAFKMTLFQKLNSYLKCGYYKLFQRIIAIIFLSIKLNMCLGCSKEPYHRGGTFEYPQHMFWLRNTKNIFQLRSGAY